MNNCKYVILIMMSLYGLTSCGGSDCKIEYYNTNHFINCYRDWSSFKLSSYYNVIYIYFDYKSNYYYSEEIQILLNKNQSKDNLDTFNKLAEKNNDIGYNYKASYFPGDDFRTTLTKGFTDINITSDRDYDESHPAGTSLNDIFRIAAYSYAQFLNGSDQIATDPDDKTLGAMFKLCSRLEHDDLLLIGSNIRIEPTHTSNVKHNITVTLTDEEGEVHSATVETDFSAK